MNTVIPFPAYTPPPSAQSNMRRLREVFGQDFARSAFKTADGEAKLVGKLCEVVLLDDGTYDIWIVTPDRKPIGTRKLNNLETKLEPLIAVHKEAVYRRLDGEAYLQTTSESLVREVAIYGGIRKRRALSEQEQQRLRHLATSQHHN